MSLTKVLASLILHSYYALCFTSRFLLFHSRPMEWSEEHDVLSLREMLARNILGVACVAGGISCASAFVLVVKP